MPDNFKKVVGANVVAFRKKVGLTQEGLAERIELSTTSMQAIESGKSWMKFETALKISRVLAVSVEDIFRDPAGSKISVEIALAVINDQLGFLPPKQKKKAAPRKRKEVRALIVEDNKASRAFVSKALQKIGWEVFEVSDGTSAIAFLARDRDIDIVLSDNTMPRIDGLRLMEVMAEAYPDILRVFVSGTVDRETANAHLIIEKPFDLNELVKKVSELVNRHKSA